MRKVLDKKTMEKEAAFWDGLKKAVTAVSVKRCHK
jgi:hypothetical protein